MTLREELDAALLTARVVDGSKIHDSEASLVAVLALAKAEGFVVAVTDELIELG